MENIKTFFISCLIIFLCNSCATLNKAQGELHYNNHISKGQELQDLKKAFDIGAINKEEYDLMKEKIINDRYVKELIEKFDDDDEEESHRKASLNIEI